MFSQKHFGIEVASALQWQNWKPGGEYTKMVTLKNVTLKIKKLQYRIVNSRFFSTRYPQPIVLSPGTSITMPITFRPLKKEKYEEFIEFLTKDGKFSVAMKATLPESQMQLPESVSFGACAILDSLTETFTITNTSDLHITFQLNEDAPFKVHPRSGTLAPKTHCTVNATFDPEGAFVYETVVTCVFWCNSSHDKICKTIKFCGTGKYPHLMLKHEEQSGHDITIHFGEVNVGETVHKIVHVKNVTQVNAPFQVIQKSHSLSLDSAYVSSLYHGVVTADESIKLKIAFTPENLGVPSIDSMQVTALGLSSKCSITCVGQGRGPSLALSASSINFYVTSIGAEVSRTFKILNKVSTPAVFHLQTEGEDSVFSVNCVSGEMSGNSSQTITVKFKPTKPITHYKKLFCLVHNQEPLSIEFFGSCEVKDVKPVTLTKKHIDNNKIYMQRGISRLAPEMIASLLKEKKIVYDEDNLLSVVDEQVNSTLVKHPFYTNPYDEFFFHAVSSPYSNVTPHVAMSTRHVEFNKCSSSQIYEKTVSVSNHTHGTVTCQWINHETSAFWMTPSECDIPAMSSKSFRITFKPAVTNKMYGGEVEAYAMFKSMKDHRLVDEDTITVPWFLSLSVTGHTFHDENQLYVPQCEWGSARMVLPPAASLDQPSYRTHLLQNTGSNPVHCSFDADDTGVFSCMPEVSLTRQRFRITVFRMSPLEYGTCWRQVVCLVNDMQDYTHTFKLAVTAEQANVKLTPKDYFYFKPTCVDNVSSRHVNVQNVSRLPLKLHWRIAKPDEKILSVDVADQIIQPNEVQKHVWSFTPVEEMKHLFKADLFVSINSDDQSDVTMEKYTLRMVGESQHGLIECNKEVVEFDEIVVGNTKQQSAMLFNKSYCPLHYLLRVTESLDGNKLQNGITTLDHYDFLLPSQSSKQITISVTPKHKGYYSGQLLYRIKSIKNEEEEYKELCRVGVKGVFPLLHVDDVRGTGCAAEYSKHYLYQLFDVTNFNNLLQEDPGCKELKMSIKAKYSTSRRIESETSADTRIDFGSALVGSEPCQMRVSLENQGDSLAEWAVKYPADVQLQLEYWSQPATLEPDERHEMFVLNNKLFTVSPKQGKIEPNHSQTITFTYKHASKGNHELTLLFKVMQGREVKLHLMGETLEHGTGKLRFNTLTHTFTPIAINCCMPLVQTYPLYNPTDTPVQFFFDVAVLDRLQQENYDWRVLECLTPVGTVEAFSTFETHWIFCPLEQRTYTVDMDLIYMGGREESEVITFTGEGFLPPNDHTQLLAISSKQQILVPQQSLILSKELLDLGRLPVFSKCSRLVFLTNTSTTGAITFHWKTQSNIVIFPSTGKIKPLERILCKVTFFSDGPPAVHNVDVVCQVSDDTLVAKYLQEKEAWSHRVEEDEHLFTIRVSKSLTKAVRPGSGSRNISTNDPNKSRAPLPPINSKTDLVEERPSNNNIEPQPPVPFIVHLLVRAQTCHVTPYLKQTPNANLKIQRNRLQLQKTHNEKKCFTKEERDVFKCILDMLISDSLQDKDMLTTVDDLKTEAIPYYGMFKTSKKMLTDEDATNATRPGIDTPPELAYQSEDAIQIEDAIQESTVVENEQSTVLENEEIDVVHYEKSTVQNEELAVVQNEELATIQNEDSRIKNEELHRLLSQRQTLKRNDEFRDMLWQICNDTIFNVMTEASLDELSLTKRPRHLVRPPTVKT